MNTEYRVAAVVVTYGTRFHYLQKTVQAILDDEHVVKVIIVDNASSEKENIIKFAEEYPERIKVIHHERNLGSAGGFAAGLKAAREEQVEYIYLSDDDVIISNDFVNRFKEAHDTIGNKHAVLLARRASFWAGTDVHYRVEETKLPRTYFNILSPRIIKVFIQSIFGIKEKHPPHDPKHFRPIIPSNGWAYAGALLPIDAVKNAPLPDVTLGLYLDDIVYSWGVIDAGSPSYALMEPHLEDLEMTHNGSHTSTGLFSPHVSSTKIYYETRNRVRVSLTHKANPYMLFVQVIIWYIGVLALGFLKQGLTHASLARARLIASALYAGFNRSATIPEEVAVRI